MSRTILALLSLSACAEPMAPPAADRDVEGQRVLDEGTPDALGVISLLNDASTTVTVLDVDAKLDARAARNLVAHRDGPDARAGTDDDDLFSTVAEIDAVSYVGDATLQLLVDFARAEGWVPADEAFYGVVEGISLTKDEAAAALHAANTESREVLDLDVGLDVRAATGIVAGRPFVSLEDVALVSYVGATAIRDLVEWGLAHPATTLDAAAAEAALDAAVVGLWFTSESDYPLEVWVLPTDGGPITAADAKTVLAPAYVARPGETPLAGRAVEEITLARLFDRYTVTQDWWEESHHEEQPRWQAVRDVFELDLLDPQVFRFGDERGGELSGAIDVFVLGRTSDGMLVGVRTVSVET